MYFDEARDAFLTSTVGPFDEFAWVIAHVSIDYAREIRHPAVEVTVRTRVAKVGTTSVAFEQQVVAPDGEVAASSSSVLVAWDGDTRSSRPLTESERAKLR